MNKPKVYTEAMIDCLVDEINQYKLNEDGINEFISYCIDRGFIEPCPEPDHVGPCWAHALPAIIAKLEEPGAIRSEGKVTKAERELNGWE